jgi:hypothetical protein
MNARDKAILYRFAFGPRASESFSIMYDEDLHNPTTFRVEARPFTQLTASTRETSTRGMSGAVHDV